jgi:hypothetical protein
MKYLRNFYNNVIRGTKAEEILHLPGFWITFIFTFLCFISYDDKEFFLSAGILVYLMYKLNMYLNEKSKIDKASIYDANIVQVLDDIIQDAFNEYYILNEGFKDNKHAISAAQEKEIMAKMVDAVSARLSECTVMKLEAYYNKDALPDIISHKIFLAITSYVVNNESAPMNKTSKEQKLLMQEMSSIGNGSTNVQNDNASPEAVIRYL